MEDIILYHLRDFLDRKIYTLLDKKCRHSYFSKHGIFLNVGFYTFDLKKDPIIPDILTKYDIFFIGTYSGKLTNYLLDGSDKPEKIKIMMDRVVRIMGITDMQTLYLAKVCKNANRLSLFFDDPHISMINTVHDLWKTRKIILDSYSIRLSSMVNTMNLDETVIKKLEEMKIRFSAYNISNLNEHEKKIVYKGGCVRIGDDNTYPNLVSLSCTYSVLNITAPKLRTIGSNCIIVLADNARKYPTIVEFTKSIEYIKIYLYEEGLSAYSYVRRRGQIKHACLFLQLEHIIDWPGLKQLIGVETELKTYLGDRYIRMKLRVSEDVLHDANYIRQVNEVRKTLLEYFDPEDGLFLPV